MRALIYNWVQFDVAGEGGGVSVYLRQTIAALAEGHGWDVTFLSSGRAYDLVARRCRHRRTRNAFGHLGVRSFEIVNSPVKAPAHDAVGTIDASLDDHIVAAAFLRMMAETGPYDVVILHNVEGISTLTLEWIRARTEAALVLFLHNYHLVCPQIELLRDSRAHCDDFRDGRSCVGCLGPGTDARKAKMARGLIGAMERAHMSDTTMERVVRATAAHGHGWLQEVGRGSTIQRSSSFAAGLHQRWRGSMCQLDEVMMDHDRRAALFRRWRDDNARRANACADALITVSARARDQLAARGLDPSRITVLYPGFDFYANASERRRRFETTRRGDDSLRLGFFGYATPSKGLELLIDALEEAGPWARQLELHVACRRDDHLHRRLLRLSDHLAAVRWIDGYDREEFAEIVQEIDLAVVPSICVETYGITAYELTMAGVPVLMSNSVGFGELVDGPDFHFRAGDKVSLLSHLERLATDRDRLADYWRGVDRVPSLDEHLGRFLATTRAAIARRRR